MPSALEPGLRSRYRAYVKGGRTGVGITVGARDFLLSKV
jgi:hypothetical protein